MALGRSRIAAGTGSRVRSARKEGGGKCKGSWGQEHTVSVALSPSGHVFLAPASDDQHAQGPQRGGPASQPTTARKPPSHRRQRQHHVAERADAATGKKTILPERMRRIAVLERPALYHHAGETSGSPSTCTVGTELHHPAQDVASHQSRACSVCTCYSGSGSVMSCRLSAGQARKAQRALAQGPASVTPTRAWRLSREGRGGGCTAARAHVPFPSPA